MKALLIRHATGAGQAPDAPLTAKGAAQAANLVDVLTELDAGPLYSSPFTRAQDTLAPYAKASGQKITVLPELRERLLSPDMLSDWQEHIRRSFYISTYAAAGGESHTHVFVRAARAFRVIAAEGGKLPTIVTHGGVISALFSRADPNFGFEDWKDLRNPDVFEVEIADRRIVYFERHGVTV